MCSQTSVITVTMQPLDVQISKLISGDYYRFDDALTLCDLFPRGKEKLREQYKIQICRLKGYYLFSQGKRFGMMMMMIMMIRYL